MFWECLSFLASCVYSILQITIPGTSITFLQLTIGLAFLPVLINVFARVFGGSIGVDTALRSAVELDRSRNSPDDE